MILNQKVGKKLKKTLLKEILLEMKNNKTIEQKKIQAKRITLKLLDRFLKNPQKVDIRKLMQYKKIIEYRNSLERE